MSALLAVVSTVAATPMPSPQVVKEVITNNLVPQTPQNVLDLAQLLALAGAGALTSVVHLAVERGKLPGNVNRLLFTLYSTVAGLVVLVLAHGWNWDWAGVVTAATAFLAFLGSSQGQKMLTDFVAGLVNKTTTDTSTGVAVPLVEPDPVADAPA